MELEEEILEERRYLMNAMFASMEQSIIASERRQFFRQNALKHLRYLCSSLENSLSVEEKAIILDEMIVGEIKTALSYYHKDDLITGTFLIKEIARYEMLKQHEPDDAWVISNEFEVTLILQKIILQMEDKEFIGASLSDKDSGYYGFVTAIAWARILTLLRENLERFRYYHFTNDILDLVIELYEPQELIDFYDAYIKMGGTTKPEDIELSSSDLVFCLEKQGKLEYQIYASVENELKRNVGFGFTETEEFSKWIIGLFREISKDSPVIIFPENELIETISKKENLNVDKLRKIIDFFSVNMLLDQKKNATERYIELRSIYKTNGILIFGFYDLIENLHIFKQLVFGKHFINMYFIPDSNAFNLAQKKMSSLLSFKIADLLNQNGYIIPTQKVFGRTIIKVEIDKILNGKINILSQVGDIDVLAYNPKNYEVLNIEFKYYKPGMDLRELILKDKKVNDGDVIEKVKARAKVLTDNIELIINYLGQLGDSFEKNYKVRSILITARPNFFCISNVLDIEYMSWQEFEQKVLTQKL